MNRFKHTQCQDVLAKRKIIQTTSDTREGAKIHWGDETALVNTDVRGGSYAKQPASQHMTMLEQSPDQVQSYFQDRRARHAAYTSLGLSNEKRGNFLGEGIKIQLPLPEKLCRI